MKNKLNIGVITSTRADFYLLEKIIDRLKKKSNIKLIISGSHFSKKYGFSYKHLFKLKKCKKIKVKLNIDDTSKKNITINSSKIIKECSEIFHIENLDSLIVFGGRYEILCFVYFEGLLHFVFTFFFFIVCLQVGISPHKLITSHLIILYELFLISNKQSAKGLIPTSILSIFIYFMLLNI